MTSLLEKIVDFNNQIDFNDLPSKIKDDLKSRFLDTLGICIAASKSDFSNEINAFMKEFANSNENCSVFGLDKKASLEMAAFSNGSYAHSLDFDDTHIGAVTHPSSVIFSTAWSIAEEKNSTIQEFTEAVFSGLTTMLIVGDQTVAKEGNKNSILTTHGFHPTSVVGTLGAATVASKLLKLDKEQTISAHGIAVSQSSGLIEANKTGHSVKRIHAGWAAMSGVMAAKLALAGVTGPTSALDGELGFLKAFCGVSNEIEEITAKIVYKYFDQLTYNPYPTNAYIHGAIDGIMSCVKENNVNSNNIKRINVGLSTTQKQITFEPASVKKNPPSAYAARFSMPFVLASVIVRQEGSLRLVDFNDDAINDSEMKKVMDKIEAYVDPEMEDIFPQAFPANIDIELTDGTRVHKKITTNFGMPTNPVTHEYLVRKFKDNTENVIEQEKSNVIIDIIENLYDY